jgi:hypothetical protein
MSQQAALTCDRARFLIDLTARFFSSACHFLRQGLVDPIPDDPLVQLGGLDA